MIAHIYMMECLTNLHVGNGEANYNIIDNEVEKDPVLGTPTINASGVKGALKEHFERLLSSAELDQVFGSEQSRGGYKFFSASLLARPLRVSEGTVSYTNATTHELLAHFNQMCAAFSVPVVATKPELKDAPFISGAAVKEVEGYKCVQVTSDEGLFNLIGANWAVTSSEIFNAFSLPVITRNVLDEKGQSMNLWFEEIVPHKSRFFFVILTPSFENILDKHIGNAVVQFGGNASIGYGFCMITKVGVSHE